MIARAAGFTRSNIYRYFATREEVFLDILQADLTAWIAGLADWIAPGAHTVPAFVERWVDSLLEHPHMLGLLAVLGTKLEEGSSIEALAAFKRQSRENHLREIGHLTRAFPGLAQRDAHKAIQMRSALVVGAFPAIFPTQKQREAMDQAGIPFPGGDYRDAMVAAIESFMIRVVPDQSARL